MFYIKNKKSYLARQEPTIEGSSSVISFVSHQKDAWEFQDKEFAKFVSYYLNFKYNYVTYVEEI